MTPSGWIRISDYISGEIAEWRPETLALEYRVPLGYVAKPATGFIRFHNQHAVDMALSADHTMGLYDRAGAFTTRTAADVAEAPGCYRLPIHFTRTAPDQDPFRLMLQVAISADGCFPKRGNQVVITVRKPRKVTRLRWLLTQCGIEYKEHQHSTRHMEKTFAFSRNGWQKPLPTEWYRSLNSENAAIVVDEATFWDGNHKGDPRLYTTCKADADLVQFLAHACGRRATIKSRKDDRNAEWSEVFTVHIAKRGSPKSNAMIRKNNISIDHIHGDRQYCFTTSTGFFLARRNGRVFVTGNSGTSTACMHRIWATACEQEPGPDGVARTRWLIIRNTFGDLKDTTMKTWSYWFEEMVGGAFGEMQMSKPPRHHIRLTLDTKIVDCEVIFLALDVEEDVRKLMSSEPTGVFFNEAQFTQKAIFDEAQSRVALGRYPPKLDGGPTWHGIIADLNAPPEGHWIPYMRGDVPLPIEWDDDQRAEYTRPEEWNFYLQPPGLIETFDARGRMSGYEENNRENREAQRLRDIDYTAENQKWLTQSYLEVIKGKSKEWIDARVMNRVGIYRPGRPVFPSFRPEYHVATEPLQYAEGFKLIVGLDFARNPAAVFGQNVRGQLLRLSELGAENVSASTFAPMVKQHIADRYPKAILDDGPGVEFWGDPTGNSKGQATDKTPYQIFMVNGMPVIPAPGNNSIELRINTIDKMLNSTTPAGLPTFLMCPTCTTLKTAYNGGYHYKKIQGQNAYHPEPNKKSHFADYADADQYMALGAGFGDEVLTSPQQQNRKAGTRTRRKKYSLREKR